MPRPKLTLDEAMKRVKDIRPSDDDTFLLGIRGYYRDSMGEPGKNDAGLYDDAIFVMGPDCFVAFNANCDPSQAKKRKDGRGMAVLKTGVWSYKLGTHNGSKASYPALVQNAPVTVRRVTSVAEFDSGGGEEETGMFGINIHRGGQVNTGSEGCQTIPAPQWQAFYSLVKGRMFGNQDEIDYVLLDWTTK